MSVPGDGSASPSGDALRNILTPFKEFLKIVHVNAQSLCCHIDEFRDLFGSQLCDIILVSESWLKPPISDRAVELQNYVLLRNDRIHKNGGGVAAYVRSGLKSNILFKSDTSRPNRPEFMFFDLSVHTVKLLVGVCYRPPHIGFLSEFEDALMQNLANYTHVVIMGDFNTDLLGRDTFDKAQLTTMFYTCNMSLLPLQATHRTATSETLLDLMVVSDDKAVLHHGQISVPGLSAHDLVYCVYVLKCPKLTPKIISYRDYKSINFTQLFVDANTLPWYDIYSTNNVNVMLDIFNENMLYLYNKHAPFKRKRVTKNPAPWITTHIRQLMKDRDRKYGLAKRTRDPAVFAEYRRLRNRCKQELRNSKCGFVRGLLNSNKSSASTWRTLKNLGVGREKNKPTVVHNLDLLNTFFTGVPDGIERAQDYANSVEVNDRENGFSFAEVSEIDIINCLMHIKSNAVGADSIPIKFIKDTLPLTLPFITCIFNTSLRSCIFPDAWKYSIVFPLNKVPFPTSPSDYRPISILPALSKCLERLVHQQMYNFIYQEQLLSDFQSGFRKGHSTATALLRVTDDVRLAMDCRKATLMVLIDFSKAFDCIYHPILYVKLRNLGFSSESVAWVRSYLSDRRQCVRSDGVTSDWRSICRGVPQGSVLGPLLFSLYINDVTEVLNNTKHHMYADDLQVYGHFHVKELASIVDKVNIDLAAVSEWAVRHGLKINETKSKAIIIGYTRLVSRVDFSHGPFVVINGRQLNYSRSVRNLGLLLTSTLDWTDHVNETCNRVFAGIHSLKRIRSLVPLSVRVMLVKTLLFPYFNYCDVVIHDMTVGLAERLQRAQNYCIRFIFELNRDDHVTPYFERLSVSKLNDLRIFHILMLLFNILKYKRPSYLAAQFTFAVEHSGRGTRHGSSLLVVPRHRTVMYNKSFHVVACRLWNLLPSSVKSVEERARFGVAVAGWIGRGVVGLR